MNVLTKNLTIFLLLIMIIVLTILLGVEYTYVNQLRRQYRELNQQTDQRFKAIEEVFKQAQKIKANIHTLNNTAPVRIDPDRAADIAYAVIYAGRIFGIEDNIIIPVIAVESGFDADAVSAANYRGLMQLSPGKLDDWRNIYQNIYVGTKYLAVMRAKFIHWETTLAGYNSGPNCPWKMLASRGYIRRVRWYQRRFEERSPGFDWPRK